MIFNGHTSESVDELDEETFTDIQIMYADGILGNKKILQVGAETNLVIYNYLRGKNQKSYETKDFLGQANAYIYYEPSVEEKQAAAVTAWATLLPQKIMERMSGGNEAYNHLRNRGDG